AEVRITAEDLIRAFTGDDHLVSRVADGTAQEVLGHAMCIKAKRFRLKDGIRKMIGQVILMDWDWIKFGPNLSRHLLSFRLLVVGAWRESERKCSYRFRMMLCGQPQDRTGV